MSAQIIEFETGKVIQQTEVETMTDSEIVDEMLEAAKGRLGRVLILGRTLEGRLFIALSAGQIADTLLILERAKKVVLELGEEDGSPF